MPNVRGGVDSVGVRWRICCVHVIYTHGILTGLTGHPTLYQVFFSVAGTTKRHKAPYGQKQLTSFINRFKNRSGDDDDDESDTLKVSSQIETSELCQFIVTAKTKKDTST